MVFLSPRLGSLILPQLLLFFLLQPFPFLEKNFLLSLGDLLGGKGGLDAGNVCRDGFLGLGTCTISSRCVQHITPTDDEILSNRH